MLINNKHKFVYIPIPGAMPYYVYDVLKRVFPESEILTHILYGATPELKYKDYRKFTVAMNPFIRQLLVWEILTESYNHRKYFLPEVGKSFSYFIEWGILQNPRDKRLLEGNKFLYTQNEWFGDQVIDNTFQIETLFKDLQHCTEVDLSAYDFPLDLKISDKPWFEYYDERTKELLKLWCKNDFKRFDYTDDLDYYVKEIENEH